MDQKLDYLTRRVNTLSSRGAQNRASADLPEVPQGMVLPADTIRDLKNASDILARDHSAKRNLVCFVCVCFFL